MSTAKQSIDKEQARYKRNFDARLRKPSYKIPVGFFVFLRKLKGSTKGKQHKLSPVPTDPFRVMEVRDDTVVIEDGDAQERVSRDPVQLAPNPLEYSNRSAKPNKMSPKGSAGSPEGTSQLVNADTTSPPAVVGRITPCGIPEGSALSKGPLDLPMEDNAAPPRAKAKLKKEEPKRGPSEAKEENPYASSPEETPFENHGEPTETSSA